LDICKKQYSDYKEAVILKENEELGSATRVQRLENAEKDLAKLMAIKYAMKEK
jgi:hypothetical protein